MPKLTTQLDLARCPYCSVDSPSLHGQSAFPTRGVVSNQERVWKAYACLRCGGVVVAWSSQDNGEVSEFYPKLELVDPAIPEPAGSYLQQAINSRHAPAGAVMLCASAVDAMLKAKNYTEGSLYSRIDKAASEHLFTAEMAQWAHEVRLDANEQRHADQAVPLPTAEDARRSTDFALALGEFLFVLPSKVRRGLADVAEKGGAA